MKILCLITVLFMSPLALGGETFSKKIYTPQIVHDHKNEGAKGAVQLLWQRSSDEYAQYEIEVSNGQSVYSQTGDKHFQHIMIYFGKDYQWRVREVGSNHSSKFSPWRPLKVLKGKSFASHDSMSRDLSSDKEVIEYYLDTGDQ